MDPNFVLALRSIQRLHGHGSVVWRSSARCLVNNPELDTDSASGHVVVENLALTLYDCFSLLNGLEQLEHWYASEPAWWPSVHGSSVLRRAPVA